MTTSGVPVTLLSTASNVSSFSIKMSLTIGIDTSWLVLPAGNMTVIVKGATSSGTGLERESECDPRHVTLITSHVTFYLKLHIV